MTEKDVSGMIEGKKPDPIGELRAALLNWYPFEPGKRAFLFGEKTGIFRSLLDPFFDEIEMADLASPLLFRSDSYDCVILLDVLEKNADAAPQILADVSAHLNPGGTLLLGFRNKFGLKYLCGGVDEFVQSPMEAAAGGGDTNGLHIFGKQEMNKLLKQAGFPVIRYYYPMPDADFTQAVYTDEQLPADSIRDRVFPYDPYGSPFLLAEADLYDDIVREKVLPFTANYFLAESRKVYKPGRHVTYAALSTDRGPEHGFATIIWSDRTACKKVLDPKGIPALRQIYDNLENLRKRGILTVDQILEDDQIIMPFVREEALLVFLRRTLSEDRDAFLDVFRQIREDVLASSRPGKLTDEEAFAEWGTDAAELGPILETAYIDMIPYNAFKTGDRIRYYDQEFTVKNCPALYVMFRALRYTWLHIREAEQFFPLEEAKKQFGLTELWNVFQEREDRFVAENRNYEKLGQLYDWANIDRGRIAFRRNWLKFESEMVKKQEDLIRDVHEVQLRLLKKLDRVCKENGLQYMAIHGTLLGAARHHGFIPWDDDIDVVMPRKDYDRLLSAGKELFPMPYFLQTPLNNYGCYYGGYSKLRYEGTAAFEPQNRDKSWGNCHQGIWIDIMPLDECPPPGKQRDALQKKLRFLQRIIFAKAYPMKAKYPSDLTAVSRLFYHLLACFTPRKDLIRLFDRLCREVRSAGFLTISACYYGNRENKNIWPSRFFESVVELQFEKMLMPVPGEWELILRQRYGNDFMSLPPGDKRWRHHNVDFYPNLGSIEDGD